MMSWARSSDSCDKDLPIVINAALVDFRAIDVSTDDYKLATVPEKKGIEFKPLMKSKDMQSHLVQAVSNGIQKIAEDDDACIGTLTADDNFASDPNEAAIDSIDQRGVMVFASPLRDALVGL